MRKPVRTAIILLFGALSWSVLGCGGQPSVPPEDAMEHTALRDIGEIYRVHTLTKGQPLKNSAELEVYEMTGPAGVSAVKNGDIVVQWEATLPDTSEEPGKVTSNEVLAYQKEVPESGGYVLMLDRTVKKMSAEEFQAAPKAGVDGSEK